jgi:hypothetical protein
VSAAKSKVTGGKRMFAAQKRVGNCDLLEPERPPRKPSGFWTINGQRLREIETLIELRYGSRGCTSDDAELYLRPALDHLVRHHRAIASRLPAGDSVVRRASDWTSRWLPDLPEAVVDEAIRQAEEKPLIYTAPALGHVLRVNSAERDALGLKTIRACDRTEEEHNRAAKARKTAKRRESRAKNRKPRPASAEKHRPWVDLGISRTKYYENRKRARTVRTTPDANKETYGFLIADTEVVRPHAPGPDGGTRALGARVRDAVEPLRSMAASFGSLVRPLARTTEPGSGTHALQARARTAVAPLRRMRSILPSSRSIQERRL